MRKNGPGRSGLALQSALAALPRRAMEPTLPARGALFSPISEHNMVANSFATASSTLPASRMVENIYDSNAQSSKDSRFNRMTTPASDPDAQPSQGFRVVEIAREPIELYKILKFEGIATSGGEAKAAVASGEVLVNGKSETRKRKKIVSGDTIEFKDEKIRIKLLSAISENTALPGQNPGTEAQGSEKE